MPISKYQKEKLQELKKKAAKLYREGFTTRQVGKVVGRSRQWVSDAVKEFDRTWQGFLGEYNRDRGVNNFYERENRKK